MPGSPSVGSDIEVNRLEHGMRSFTHDGAGERIVFGAGTIAVVPTELDRLGSARALVLSTPQQAGLAERVAALIGDRWTVSFTGAVMHTPADVTRQAVELAREHRADAVVSVGGGSTTGLGKAVAVRLGLPHLVLPTTYAGSEVTPVLGETVDGEKTTRSGPELLPDTAVYDVELTTTLPWDLTVTSAVNAMAHAVEALYADGVTDGVTREAMDAITALVSGLRALRAAAGTDDPHRLDARADLLYGAWRAGRCLAAVGMGLHHKLCHTLGGTFDLPHAPTHTVVLPYAMAYNAPAAAAAMDRVAAAIGADDAPAGTQRLVRDLGGPTALGDLGFRRDDIARAAELATAKPYPNPRPVTREGVVGLLERAQAGAPIVAVAA